MRRRTRAALAKGAYDKLRGAAKKNVGKASSIAARVQVEIKSV